MEKKVQQKFANDDAKIYFEQIEKFKERKKAIDEEISKYKAYYIDLFKPCNAGDTVTIELASGKMVIGQAKTFGILQDKGVYITCYKIANKPHYISVPHGEVIVLKQAENESTTNL